MRILIVMSTTKPVARNEADKLRDWLITNGHAAQIIRAEDIAFGESIENLYPEGKGGVDLICSLGGDGTMLSSAQLVFENPAPILGFNFGNLGFLTGATPDVLYEGVQAAIDGNIEREPRSALEVEVEDADGNISKHMVLNEVALSRGSTGKMINYDVFIDAEHFVNVRSDGVIVSSPTGSTAYALSAGGPIVSPNLSCMIVVAIAPHSLVSRALVTGPDQTVRVVPHTPKGHECMVFLDGHVMPLEDSPASLSVKIKPDAVTFLKYKAPGFVKAASHAFYGGGA